MSVLWAKRKPRNTPTAWLSLVDHSHDVAAVFEALLGLPAVEARLAALAKRSMLGHIHEAIFPLDELGTIEASGLAALADWAGNMREVLVTVLSHHGSPPKFRPCRDLHHE